MKVDLIVDLDGLAAFAGELVRIRACLDGTGQRVARDLSVMAMSMATGRDNG